METVNLKHTTGQSQEERDAEAIARIRKTNPALADTLEKHLGKPDEILITQEMRAGARANEVFHKHRLQGEN